MPNNAEFNNRRPHIPPEPEYIIQENENDDGLNDPSPNANWKEVESDNIAYQDRNGPATRETVRVERDFDFQGQDKPTGITRKTRAVHCCGHTNNGSNEFALCGVCGGTICNLDACALRCYYCQQLAGPSHRYIEPETGRVRCFKCRPKELNILVVLLVVAIIVFLFFIYSRGCV